MFTKFYFSKLHPPIAGALCAVEHEGKFLFVRETYGGEKWTFPGGRVRRNESPEEGIRREIKEELGIVLGPITDIGEHYAEVNGQKQGIARCFSARAENQNLILNRSEIKEAGWFALPEVPAPYSPAVPKVIRLLEKIRK